MKFQELEARINKHMMLADTGVLKLLTSFLVGSKLPVSPPWLFLVGASSGGKSMLLSAIEGINGVYPLDDLTSNTFVSGMKGPNGEDVSLIMKLLPNSTITFKDFTTILSKDKESRGIVVGQMRKIYDGDFRKTYGNGMDVKWKGKISVLAGVTSKVFTTMQQFGDMGERFVQYVFTQPPRDRLAMLATENLDEREAKEAMKEAFTQYFAELTIPDEAPKLPQELRSKIARLSDFTTLARSAVERDTYSRDKHIIQVHFAEMPGRFTKQLMSFASGMYIVNENTPPTVQDEKILFKIALDSIPNKRRHALLALTKYRQVETLGLAVEMQYPRETVALELQDLAAIGVIDYRKGPAGVGEIWELKPDYRALLSEYENVAMTNDYLTKEVAEGEPMPDIRPSNLPVDTGSEPVVVATPEEMNAALSLFDGELIP